MNSFFTFNQFSFLKSKRFWRLLGCFALLVAADLVSKDWVRANLQLYEMRPFIPNLIELTHVKNTGVSFNWFGDLPAQWGPLILLTVSALVLLLILGVWVVQGKHFNKWHHLSMVYICAGAVGNMLDRAWFGSVTDFLYFHVYSWSWFVNNIADIVISAGVLWYCIGAFIDRPTRASAPHEVVD